MKALSLGIQQRIADATMPATARGPNVPTDSATSLYKAFPAAEVRALAKRLEFTTRRSTGRG